MGAPPRVDDTARPQRPGRRAEKLRIVEKNMGNRIVAVPFDAESTNGPSVHFLPGERLTNLREHGAQVDFDSDKGSCTCPTSTLLRASTAAE